MGKMNGHRSRRTRKETAGALLRHNTKGYDPIQVQGFSPTSAQLKYLFALRDAALEGDKTSDSEMQRKTKISRMTMWEWKQDPAFRAWFRLSMQAKHDHDFELAMARHLRLAIQGSVRSFEAVARVRSVGQKGGGFTADAERAIEDRQYVINILVPRPPELPGADIGS